MEQNEIVENLEKEVAELSKLLIREQRKSGELLNTLNYVITTISKELELDGFEDVQGFLDKFNEHTNKDKEEE